MDKKPNKSIDPMKYNNNIVQYKLLCINNKHKFTL